MKRLRFGCQANGTIEAKEAGVYDAALFTENHPSRSVINL